MQKSRKQIGVLLLLSFLLPQVLSSMHYLWVPHILPYGTEEVYIPTDIGYQGHSCHYQLYGTPSLLPSGAIQGKTSPNGLPEPIVFRGLENYIQYPDYNFQLRGPPKQ